MYYALRLATLAQGTLRNAKQLVEAPKVRRPRARPKGPSRVERMTGFEPATFALARRRSSQLSYIRLIGTGEPMSLTDEANCLPAVDPKGEGGSYIRTGEILRRPGEPRKHTIWIVCEISA